MIVLRTWNLRFTHHPHVHLAFPCGGIPLVASRWISIEHCRGNQWA
jgi:hypothetical protein